MACAFPPPLPPPRSRSCRRAAEPDLALTNTQDGTVFLVRMPTRRTSKPIWGLEKWLQGEMVEMIVGKGVRSREMRASASELYRNGP